jgi:hypothetical protein
VLSIGSSSKWNSMHLVITDTKETQKDLQSYKVRFAGKRKAAMVVEFPQDFRDDKLLQVLAEAAIQIQKSRE